MKKLDCVYWDLDGTIADTEMSGHRIAFNKAFLDFNLNWNWTEKIYIELLLIAGGHNRIKYYSNLLKENLDSNLIKKIHQKKQIVQFVSLLNKL